MTQERSSGGSFVIFIFYLLSFNYGTQMNECFTKPKHGHFLFTFIFVFVSPVKHRSLEDFSGPWRVIAMDF
jgi:hypothetical protein